ncbi:membrane protein, partial [mine drainage metagenome]
MKVGAAFGDYLQALHLRPLAGRLITLRDQSTGAPVIVLSQGLAQRWFGGTAAAIGRVVYDSHGLALHVIGVLPIAFTGIEGVFSSHLVQAWVPGPLMLLLSNGSWPTDNGKLPKGGLLKYGPVQVQGLAPLLSVPADVGAPQLRSELVRVFAGLRNDRPADEQGFAWTTPYSLFPPAFSLIARRISLFLGLSIAALVLATVNVLVLRWLGYLRRRNTLQLMRVLGARRGWLLRRLLWRGLATALALLLGTALLVTLGVLLLRRLAGMLGPVLTVHALLAPLARILPIVVLLVTLVELLPLLVLLGRERLDGARTVSGTSGDRAFGAALLAAEVLLGTVMSVLAAWAIGYAWHAAHERLGVLDRPATFVDLKTVGNVFSAVAHPDLHAAQALLQNTLDTAAQVVPVGRALGFGPQIRPGVGSGMPRAISAGTQVIGACVHEVTP